MFYLPIHIDTVGVGNCLEKTSQVVIPLYYPGSDRLEMAGNGMIVEVKEIKSESLLVKVIKFPRRYEGGYVLREWAKDGETYELKQGNLKDFDFV